MAHRTSAVGQRDMAGRDLLYTRLMAHRAISKDGGQRMGNGSRSRESRMARRTDIGSKSGMVGSGRDREFLHPGLMAKRTTISPHRPVEDCLMTLVTILAQIPRVNPGIAHIAGRARMANKEGAIIDRASRGGIVMRERKNEIPRLYDQLDRRRGMTGQAGTVQRRGVAPGAGRVTASGGMDRLNTRNTGVRRGRGQPDQSGNQTGQHDSTKDKEPEPGFHIPLSIPRYTGNMLASTLRNHKISPD